MVLHGAHVVVVPLFALLTAVSSQSRGCTTPSGVSGQCVNIRECPSQVGLLQQIQSGTAPPGSLNILRESICEFRNNVPFVCCTPEPRTTQSLLPSRCGVRSLVDRVISGEDAPLLAWPWMALLESRGPNGRLTLPCGGVLISDRYVLTAAHCVAPVTGFTLRSVRIGEHTLGQDPDCQTGVCAPRFQSIEVEETIIHENYGFPHGCSKCNDIALLRLNKQVELNDLHVQPICLPQNLQRDLGFSQNEFTSKLTWVAGWGTTDPTKIQPAKTLQQVQLPINNTLCAIDIRVYPNPNMVLCAGGKSKDSCRGDSGGPMVMGNTGETKYYVIGIVSKGPRICGAADTGGLYTSTNHYVPWIIKNLRP